MSDRAVKACSEYERWASEVKRLTDAICENVCPMESPAEPETHWKGAPSCFREAADLPVVENHLGEERRANLDDIAERVKSCPECSALVGLIRDRRHARKRWGAAKRAVRYAGKVALAEPESGEGA